MSGNVFRLTQYSLDYVLVKFINYLSFGKVANRALEGEFRALPYATGQTLNYRLEERFTSQRGATATPEALVQVIRPLTISTQFHQMVTFGSMQLTFDRAMDEPFLDMMVVPRVKAIANDIEKFICSENFQPQVYQTVGTPGAALTMQTVLDTDAYMSQLGIPDDGKRYLANPEQVNAALVGTLYTLFNSTVNEGALMDGFVGRLSSFKLFKTNFLKRQISGAGQAGGSPPTGFKLAGTITNGPITGGNTFVLTGLVASSTAFNVGDKIQFAPSAGVYMVNPLTFEPLSQTAQFVVTATAISDLSGNATVSVNPTIVISGARQNISGAIPNGAQLYLADDHNESLAFHNQAIVFAAPPITELKGGVDVVTAYSDMYKMSVCYTAGSDIKNYVQYHRIDILGGVAINPEFAVCVMS